MVIIEFMDMKSTKFGGLGRFMIRLMQKMPDAKFHFVFQNFPQSEEMMKLFYELNAEVHVIDTEGKKAIKNIFKVYKLFRIIKPDIVHFHFSNSFFFYAPIAKMLGIKHLYKTQHCCITKGDLTQVANKRELSLKTKLASWNGYVYKLFDSIIMCGKYVQKQFELVYGPSEKYKMIYFGVEPIVMLSNEEKTYLKEKLIIRATDKVITTTAFADPVKGIDILIKAIPFIKKSNCIFVIIGLDDSIELTQKYQRLAKQMGVSSKIRWVGITDKVRDYLSITDIYCQPSKSEALPLAVCEAMSAYLPIIGSNVGGLPEVANICFENGDSVDLAKKLLMLIEDPVMRNDFANKSYEKFKGFFDIQIGVEQYFDIYNCI